MKKLIIAFIPALLLSAAIAVPAGKAQDTMPKVEVTMKITLNPFNLAYLAYQGYFSEEGIPDSGELLQGFRTGNITAFQVVKAAVTQNRLPASFLKNNAYISAVATQLYALTLSNR
jgi:hypothetical protein